MRFILSMFLNSIWEIIDKLKINCIINWYNNQSNIVNIEHAMLMFNIKQFYLLKLFLIKIFVQVINRKMYFSKLYSRSHNYE